MSEFKDRLVQIESHYFPCLDYFSLIYRYSGVILIDEDIYKKQEYRNRCYILGANKVEALTVPVHAQNNMLYRDVTIDYSQNWLKIHLKTIRSAYGKSPYFEHYFPLVEDLLMREIKSLAQLNKEILTLCLRLLDWEKLLLEANIQNNIDQKVDNYRNSVLIKKKGSQNLNMQEGIRYQQLFGSKFVNNLSVLDLLFNEGLQSSDYFQRHAYNN